MRGRIIELIVGCLLGGVDDSVCKSTRDAGRMRIDGEKISLRIMWQALMYPRWRLGAAR